MDRSRLKHLLWRKILPVVFFIAVVVLLIKMGKAIDWHQVPGALHKLSTGQLALAAAAAATSYLAYSAVDLFAADLIRGRVPRLTSMAVAFVSYAFNLNLGSLIGSIGFRYRLYSRFDIEPPIIARIIGLSFVTNWSGYFVLAGLVFTFGHLQLPEHWNLGSWALHLIGAVLLAIIASYVAACAWSSRREWHLRSLEINLPSVRFALGQIALSFLNWASIASVLYVLLHEHANYPTVLAVFLLASVAGLLAHIPAGLGVIEVVFFTLLGGRVPHTQLVAALLAYRAIYYLGPLAVSLPVYFWLEAHSKRPAKNAAIDEGRAYRLARHTSPTRS